MRPFRARSRAKKCLFFDKKLVNYLYMEIDIFFSAFVSEISLSRYQTGSSLFGWISLPVLYMTVTVLTSFFRPAGVLMSR